MSNRLLFFIVTFILILSGCIPGTKYDPNETNIPQIKTPLPTPTKFIVFATNVVPEPPTQAGMLEIRIPYLVEGSTVIGEPGEGNECIVEMPFEMTKVTDRIIVNGTGEIDCHYIIEPGDIPYHVDLFIQGDASFDGELLPGNDDYPAGFLDSFLNFNGNITQYYSEFQVPLTNACPEENPCIAPGSEIFNLPFHWADGSQIETNWIFILHKQPN